jgi:outer membrane protein assembly factor BamE (lipoprotein component of BamABCDE complex)
VFAHLAPAVVAVSAIVAGCGRATSDAQFDSTAWQRPAPYCAASHRSRLADEAVEAVARASDKSEVRELLGRPDATSDGDWFYYVGARPDGFLRQCVFLRVRFERSRPRAKVVAEE